MYLNNLLNSKIWTSLHYLSPRSETFFDSYGQKNLQCDTRMRLGLGYKSEQSLEMHFEMQLNVHGSFSLCTMLSWHFWKWAELNPLDIKIEISCHSIFCHIEFFCYFNCWDSQILELQELFPKPKFTVEVMNNWISIIDIRPKKCIPKSFQCSYNSALEYPNLLLFNHKRYFMRIQVS